MKRWLLRIGAIFAVAFLGLTVLNAQWLAPEPKGGVKLVTAAGLGPASGCAGSVPYHGFAPNSLASILRADKLGAAMVEVRVEQGADGAILLPVDPACGDADPASLDDLLSRLTRHARLMFNLTSADARLTEGVLDSLAEAGRDPAEERDGFLGSPEALAVIRARHPDVWAWNPDEAEACSRDYVLTGWTGLLPGSCKGKTLLIRLDNQIVYWGWPNRLLARMEAEGGNVVISAPGADPLSGIDLPEQIGEVPSTFNGYLWVDDAFAILPALYPRFDTRRQAEIDATARALSERRSQR